MAKLPSPLTDEEAADLARNARTHDDPQGRGKRLNASAACIAIRATWKTFFRHHAPHLESLPMGFNARTGTADQASTRKEKTYLEADLKASAAAAKPADTGGGFAVNGAEVFTVKRTMKELSITRHSLTEWSKAFPFGNPDTLHFRWETSPETKSPLFVCDKAKVLLAKAKLAEAATGRIELPNGKVYLSSARTMRELRTGFQHVPWPTFCGWRKACAYLDGKPIESVTLPTLRKPDAKHPVAEGPSKTGWKRRDYWPGPKKRKGTAHEPWFLEEQIQQIKAARLAEVAQPRKPTERTAREICREHKVIKLGDKIAVALLLSRKLPSRRLPCQAKDGRWTPTAVFKLADVAELLGGRPIIEMARACWKAELRARCRKKRAAEAKAAPGAERRAGTEPAQPAAYPVALCEETLERLKQISRDTIREMVAELANVLPGVRASRANPPAELMAILGGTEQRLLTHLWERGTATLNEVNREVWGSKAVQDEAMQKAARRIDTAMSTLPNCGMSVSCKGQLIILQREKTDK